MEWIDGERWPRSWSAHRCRPTRSSAIGAALADALHSVHAQDVVHLDVKPENFICCGPTAAAVLLDFGFAHHAHYPDLLAEERHFAAGSAPYVSPEQLQRRPHRPAQRHLRARRAALRTRRPASSRSAIAEDLRRTARPPVARAAAAARHRRVACRRGCRKSILRCLDAERRCALPIGGARGLRPAPSGPGRADVPGRANRRRRRAAQAAGRWWRTRCAAPHMPSRTRAHPRARHHGRGRHRASRRRTPPDAAVDDTADRRPQRRVPPDVRVGDSRGADWARARTDAETASGRHLEHLLRLRQWIAPLQLPAVAAVAARGRVGHAGRHAAGTGARQSCRT